MSTNRQKDQQNEANHRMQSYSVMKRHEVLTRATKWMNLENIMLTERNKMRESIKCTEIESRLVAAKGWGQRGGAGRIEHDYFMGTRFSLGDYDNVLEQTEVMAAQCCECTKQQPMVHF